MRPYPLSAQTLIVCEGYIPQPLCGGTKGMYPESNTLPQQPYPAALHGGVWLITPGGRLKNPSRYSLAISPYKLTQQTGLSAWRLIISCCRLMIPLIRVPRCFAVTQLGSSIQKGRYPCPPPSPGDNGAVGVQDQFSAAR
jgi:hypothetical protein